MDEAEELRNRVTVLSRNGDYFGALEASSVLIQRSDCSIADITKDLEMANAVMDFLGSVRNEKADEMMLRETAVAAFGMPAEAHKPSNTKIIDASLNHFEMRVVRDQGLITWKLNESYPEKSSNVSGADLIPAFCARRDPINSGSIRYEGNIGVNHNGNGIASHNGSGHRRMAIK